MIELRPYQQRGINELRSKISYNRSVLFQLATGGGKTFIFSFFVKEYLEKCEGNVLILVHRKELLQQTIASLQKIGIEAETIDSDNKTPDFSNRVFVAMVQTISKRLEKDSNYLDASLLIIDECHRQDFNNVIDMYKQSKIVGFSASPISASKKNPLNAIYKDIVTCADVSDLLEIGSLTTNKTFAFKGGVKRNEIKKNSFGEFSNQSMLDQFGNPKMIENTTKAYEDFCKDTKTLIFNVSVEHSKAVCEAFVLKGYDCKYLDGNSTDRAKTLDWFHNTDNAILCNIDILTTGFDEPSILSIIINRSTTSLPLWLQMTGRGGRLYPGKDHFKIIDLGENVFTHGDWSEKRDWKYLFENPKKYKEGAAPIKDCPCCGYINYASARICRECEYEYPIKESKESQIFELIEIKKIEPEKFLANNQGYKPARAVHKIQETLVQSFKKVSKTEFESNKNKFIDHVFVNFWEQYSYLHTQKPTDYKKSHYNRTFWKEQLEDKINNFYSL